MLTLFALVSSSSADIIGQIPGPPRHPDGALGRPSVSVAARYSTIYSDLWTGGLDHQAYRFGLDLVLTNRLTLHSLYALEDTDGRRHELLGGFSYFFSDPLAVTGPVNADGPVGGPVVSLRGGARFFGDPDSAAGAQADARLTLPISRRLSLGTGYRWREVESSDDAISFYGVASAYFAEYPSDSAWANPDGPAGFPALRFLAGANGGNFGAEVQLLAPLQADLTLAAALRTERLHDPDRTAYSIELALFWYLTR